MCDALTTFGLGCSTNKVCNQLSCPSHKLGQGRDIRFVTFDGRGKKKEQDRNSKNIAPSSLKAGHCSWFVVIWGAPADCTYVLTITDQLVMSSSMIWKIDHLHLPARQDAVIIKKSSYVLHPR